MGRKRSLGDEDGVAFDEDGRTFAGMGTDVGDYDLDLVVTNLDAAPTVLRNDGHAGRSLRVRLRGSRSNRNGIGAIVVVTDAGGRSQRAIASTASSYQSASDSRLHFGLGASTAKRLEVHWPSGILQTLTALPPYGQVDVEEPTH